MTALHASQADLKCSYELSAFRQMLKILHPRLHVHLIEASGLHNDMALESISKTLHSLQYKILERPEFD